MWKIFSWIVNLGPSAMSFYRNWKAAKKRKMVSYLPSTIEQKIVIRHTDGQEEHMIVNKMVVYATAADGTFWIHEGGGSGWRQIENIPHEE
jgi:hypothetical protein